MKKITLFLMSLFLTVGAMAQVEPFLTFDNLNLENGPVVLTAEQAKSITDKNAITVIVEADVTNSTDASIVLGVIKDYNGAMNVDHDILALGIGGNQARFYIGNGTGQYFSRGTVGTGKKCLAYTLNANGNDNLFINRALLEPTRLFSIPKTFKDFTGDNAKFYIGGIKSNTATWGTFKGTIYSVKIYEGSLTENEISAIFEKEKNEAKSFVDSFKNKVGYPNESAVETYISAIDNSIIAKDFETAKNALYNSTDINLPVDGGIYTFTFVHKSGEKFYINCTGSALALVKLEEGVVLPNTAMFRTYINDDGTTYCVKTYNDKYIKYPTIDSGISDDADGNYNNISFDKMCKSGNYVQAENKDLFGYIRIISRRNASNMGAFVAKKTTSGGFAFDNSSGYHFEDRANTINSFTTAILVERVDVPTYGKYFRLKGNSGQYLTNDGTGGNNYNTTLQTKSEADINSIFYIEQGDAENKFYILSYENGHYVANPYRIGVGEEAIPSSNEKYKQQWEITGSNGVYTFKYGIEFGNGYYMTNPETGGTGWSADVNEFAYWTLEEVTSLPVTITAAKYATFYAPVAVTVPANVIAYTATIDGDRVILNEITGVIPANTGVVLYAETANTYYFAITENVEGIASDLRGSVATTYYTAAGTYYALGVVDDVTAFYKDTFKNDRFQNNSHKAYLYVEGTNPAALSTSLRFDFDGNTTAIEEVETENAETVIYDLTGRRVNEINKAGVYIVNGKKVMVK